MSIDLFNNISNDYINPDLSPCAGDSDDSSFEFLPNEEIGIVSGSDVLSSIDLGDMSQEIDGWVQQTKILQAGEVIFIQGLTKGISYRYQRFPFDGSVAYDYDGNAGEYHQYYMTVDMSINYYKNFRYYNDAVHAEGDYDNGITIENALDIALDNKGITVTASYDTSALSFTGDSLGYAYNITAIDVSVGIPDSSAGYASLVEDTSSAIAAFKYPNGAMLGYALKVTYPSTATASTSYVEINHVPDFLEYFEASTGNTSCYVRYYKEVDVGLSVESCATDRLSASQYLDLVETNSLWEKVGPIRLWISAEDPTNSNVENLITGFYVYNPQSFAVQIDYMTII
jgi:hypothetical protein